MRGILSTTLFVIAGGVLFYAIGQQKLPLPAPYATKSVRNSPKVIPQPEGAKLKLPPGFQIEVYAEGFNTPRFMLNGPNSEVLLSDSAQNGAGAVWILKGRDKKALISGLTRPYGLALHDGFLYVGEPESVKRFKYDSKAGTVGAAEKIISLEGHGQGHWTRSLLFDRQGKKLYMGVGSRSNVDAGEDPKRAAIHRYNPDGTGYENYATGTRNPIGLHWYPGTDTLWAAVQERDELGDDLVPDYFTHIQQGGFYGWPYAYSGPNEDPRRKGERPDLVAKTIQGDVLLGSHVAVLDFTFYTGNMLPAEYRGGAFIALHGSWNRSSRVGQQIVFIPFKNGKPSGPIKEIVGGWVLSPDQPEVWGRPVAVLQMPDGSLLISDDGGKKIWRLSYKG
jgi:glucose/arabinose dehydrogenase